MDTTFGIVRKPLRFAVSEQLSDAVKSLIRWFQGGLTYKISASAMTR